MTHLNQWNRALITGASSGIGLEICKILAEQGTDLVIVARNKERLEEFASEQDVDIEVIPADLGLRTQLFEICERVKDSERPIDLVVNCAGFGNFGEFKDLNLQEETEVIEINVIALHQICHAAASVMTMRKRGWILNVSSIAGFAPYAKSATYGGTKAFVNNFSEALISELKPHGVVVSYLCPGTTKTNFQARAKVGTDSVPNFMLLEAADVAKTALEGLAKGKAAIIPGAQYKVAKGIIKFLPSGTIRKASEYISSRRSKH